MKLLCYAFKNENQELEAPFLNFLQTYVLKDSDSERKKSLKSDAVLNIQAHLEHLVTHKKTYTLKYLVQKYKSHDLEVLKIKQGNHLLRVIFYSDHDKIILLLNAYTKPKFYEKAMKRRVNKNIQKLLDQAQVYLEDYRKNHLTLPLNYES